MIRKYLDISNICEYIEEPGGDLPALLKIIVPMQFDDWAAGRSVQGDIYEIYYKFQNRTFHADSSTWKIDMPFEDVRTYYIKAFPCDPPDLKLSVIPTWGFEDLRKAVEEEREHRFEEDMLQDAKMAQMGEDEEREREQEGW